jgi:hypothetical protein
MSTLNRLFALCVLACAACGQSQTTQVAGAPAPAAPVLDRRDGAQAPVTVAIDVMKGAPAARATIALRAHVFHPPTWTVPIDLEIRLPAGVSLASGSQRTTLTPSPGRTVEDVDFEVQLDADVPLSDIVVVAAHQSKATGVHAEGHYRFGRPEPLPVVPDRTGPELTTAKGGNLGRAVPLEPAH